MLTPSLKARRQFLGHSTGSGILTRAQQSCWRSEVKAARIYRAKSWGGRSFLEICGAPGMCRRDSWRFGVRIDIFMCDRKLPKARERSTIKQRTKQFPEFTKK